MIILCLFPCWHGLDRSTGAGMGGELHQIPIVSFGIDSIAVAYQMLFCVAPGAWSFNISFNKGREKVSKNRRESSVRLLKKWLEINFQTITVDVYYVAEEQWKLTRFKNYAPIKPFHVILEQDQSWKRKERHESDWLVVSGIPSFVIHLRFFRTSQQLVLFFSLAFMATTLCLSLLFFFSEMLWCIQIHFCICFNCCRVTYLGVRIFFLLKLSLLLLLLLLFNFIVHMQ